MNPAVIRDDRPPTRKTKDIFSFISSGNFFAKNHAPTIATHDAAKPMYIYAPYVLRVEY
jgi:hypothetical protein